MTKNWSPSAVLYHPFWEAQDAVISTSIKVGLNLKPQALPASALLYKSSFLLSRA